MEEERPKRMALIASQGTLDWAPNPPLFWYQPQLRWKCRWQYFLLFMD